MSENDLCDTAMEQQAITEACTACTSQHKPHGDMQHFLRFHCQERESVTHISERHRNALPRKNHVLHNCANVFCVLVQPCFHPDENEKIHQWRHHHADRTLCRSFSVIVMDHLFLTTVNMFGSTSYDDVQSTLIRRTRVDEVRRTRTETIRLPPCNGRQTECTSIDAYFLCPYGPLPLTQTRQERVHRARRTRKGLFCIYVGGVYRPTCWRVSTA